MLDLKNMPDVLKTGVIKEKGAKVTLLTPAFRLSYPTIVEPEQYNNAGAYRYTISMLYNTGRHDAGAYVDLDKIVKPSFAHVASANGMHIKGSDVSPLGSGYKYNAGGDEIDGYEEWTEWFSAAKYPKKSPTGWPVLPCYGLDQQPKDPSEFYGGCYARACIQLYKPKKWKRVSVGLNWVQFLADGEPFAAPESAPDTVDSVPGVEGITAGVDNIQF